MCVCVGVSDNAHVNVIALFVGSIKLGLYSFFSDLKVSVANYGFRSISDICTVLVDMFNPLNATEDTVGGRQVCVTLSTRTVLVCSSQGMR